MQILYLLLPIFIILILGYFLRITKFLDDHFWNSLNKMIYFILFPALIIYKLSSGKLNYFQSIDIILVVLISLSIMVILAIFTNKIFNLLITDLSVIIQGFIRFNTFIFLAFVDLFFDNKFFILSILIISIYIILVNIISVYFLTAINKKNGNNIFNAIKKIFKNPLVISCIIGISINILNIKMPSFLNETLLLLQAPTLMLGILNVGAGLYLINLWDRKYVLFFISFSKLVVYPMIIIFVGIFFQLDQQIIFLLALFTGTPTAFSSFILTKELQGDYRFMSSVITSQTLLSLISLSIIVFYFKS